MILSTADVKFPFFEQQTSSIDFALIAAESLSARVKMLFPCLHGKSDQINTRHTYPRNCHVQLPLPRHPGAALMLYGSDKTTFCRVQCASTRIAQVELCRFRYLMAAGNFGELQKDIREI